MGPEHFVTLNSALVALNTCLFIAAGFLFRDAWSNVHERIDRLESQQTKMIADISGIQGQLQGRRYGDPHRETL